MEAPKNLRSARIRERLVECIHNGELENSDLLEIFKHVGHILGACTVKKYAEINQISPQAAHSKCLNDTFGFKMMFDNK